MAEAAFFKWSHPPDPNCYDSSPLSLFYLDIAPSCDYIKRRATHKSVLLCGETMRLEQRQSSWSTMIISVGDHLTHQIGSGEKIRNEASLFRLDLA